MALSYGYLVGHFAEIVGDRNPGDPDRYPDEVSTRGSVTFTPTPSIITDIDSTTGLGTLYTPRAIIAELGDDGHVQDANHLEGIWLLAGIEYTATLSFMSMSAKFVLSTANDLDHPKDLIKQFGLTPDPSTKFIVNEQVYTDTLAAAARAEAAASDAENASGGPRVSSLNGRSGEVTITKNDVGLPLVSNLAPADYPVSTAQLAAISARVPATRTVGTGTGLTGGGALAQDLSIALAGATVASLAKADSAVQPAGLTAATAPIVAGGRLGALSKNIDSQNLNLLFDNGFYCGGNLGNAPGNDTGVWLVRMHRSYDNSMYAEQVATKLGLGPGAAGPAYRRIAEGADGSGNPLWGSWRETNDALGAVDTTLRNILHPAERLSPRGRDVSGTDIHNLPGGGWYSGQSLTNAPAGDDGYYYLFVEPYGLDDAWLRVTATEFATSAGVASPLRRTWVCQKQSGGWSAWTLVNDSAGAIDPTARTTAAAAATKTYTDAQIATRIQKGAQAIVYADIDPSIATAINNGASAYNQLGSKADLVGGVIPTSQLPAIALESITVVSSQGAMLALTAQAGDVAKRTDLSGEPFMLGGDGNPATLANWISLDRAASATGIQSVNGQTTSAVVLGKADVGLGSVDNTADTAKPVSTAQQTALNAKAPLASPAFTGTPTGITAAHVGLGNVTNTSDANKPVSTAQQTALNGKVGTDGTVLNVVSITAAAYAALGTKSATTLYAIVG